eukprot:SAG11_NODE_2929_length_2830_cov_8.013914_2_plen_73_part_00
MFLSSTRLDIQKLVRMSSGTRFRHLIFLKADLVGPLLHHAVHLRFVVMTGQTGTTWAHSSFSYELGEIKLEG